MKFFHHLIACLGFLLVISLAASSTHDTVLDLLSLPQPDHAEAERTASTCQDEADCEGCICTCHTVAESPQLDHALLPYPLVAYLTPSNPDNYYSTFLKTLERPPKYSQI